MIYSEPLRWLLLVALSAAGLTFVGLGLRSGLRPVDRLTHAAHSVMAAAMLVMIWPAS
ncbi:hypothetical protein [Hamadaea tsunoensis]|uniref:hypothetical protein n=1 Tax=Hamadaea tsunoensis TaxID=53368 RepID=UPI00040DCB39|nr:hypothetical protein [Hamadaea tsunoensis]